MAKRKKKKINIQRIVAIFILLGVVCSYIAALLFI